MSDQELSVRGVRLVALRRISGEFGDLIVGELPLELPFRAERIFTLLDIPEGQVRGTHAHRHCEQFLICMRGSVRCVVDDGVHREEVVLDDPALGLYMPAMTWGTQYEYSSDAVLVVLASDRYDGADYIEDYEEFVRLASAAGDRR